jgi:hypothetical protein
VEIYPNFILTTFLCKLYNEVKTKYTVYYIYSILRGKITTIKEAVLMSDVAKWGKYVDEKLSYQDMKAPLELALGRKLTKAEEESLFWLSDAGWLTVGTFVGMFEELANKSK